MPQQPILINGAGLSGLLLAHSLHLSNIPFEVYEQDSANARFQGWRICITQDGIDALTSVLPEDDWVRFRSACPEFKGVITAMDPRTLEKLETPSGPPRRGPQTDFINASRTRLRETLLQGIRDHVHFGKKCIGYEVLVDGVILNLADGSKSSKGVMLVGADGVNSIIAQQLSRGMLQLIDTKARQIRGSTPRDAWGPREAPDGVCGCKDESRGPGRNVMVVFSSTYEDEKKPMFSWTLTAHAETFGIPEDDKLSSYLGAQAAELSLKVTQGWSPELRSLFMHQDKTQTLMLRMTSGSPDGIPLWADTSRVTLLGDAVHPMTHTTWSCANTALKDAETLGNLLRERGGWDESVVRAYEEKMRTYAVPKVKQSLEMANRLLGLK